VRFRIADELWDGARPEREREWLHALMDLNAEHDGHEPVFTIHRRADGGAAIALMLPGGGERVAELSYDMLRDPFREYREIIARLARADGGTLGMRDWESLDYAKKMVEDEAAARIRKALTPHMASAGSAGAAAALPAVIDLRLARRLFTLVFLVACDVPAELVTRHRRHGPDV
jgi:hypothetical protein